MNIKFLPPTQVLNERNSRELRILDEAVPGTTNFESFWPNLDSITVAEVPSAEPREATLHDPGS